MKRAKALDYWRHISTKSGRLSLSEVEFSNVYGFGTFSAALSQSRLLMICGHNGAGKTTFSRLMQACLTEAESDLRPAEVARLSSGKITVRGSYQGRDFETSYSTKDGSKTGDVIGSSEYLEPAHEVPELQRLLRRTIDLEEILEATGHKQIPVDDHCFAVGKRYEEISIAEVEIDGTIKPFFWVKTCDGSYDSRNMGLGELSIFYLIWWLSVVERGTLIFIEEPEVFISPRSQRAFADLLAKFCDEKDLYIVSTTHSSSVLEPVPKECIWVISKIGGDTQMLPVTRNEEHLAVLGMSAAQRGVILVEDLAARALLGCVLRKYSLDIAKRLPIVSRGSHGDVINSLNEIPRDLQPFTFLGVLDGDRKGYDVESEWSVYFLPGTEPPDLQLMRFGESNLSRVSEELRVDQGQLRASMEGLQGDNFHDWTKELAKRIGVAEWTILTALAELLLESDEALSEEARALAGAIAGEVG
jgi:energy-coupling factor transporter ATP-binding protein EcfA2